MDAEVQRPPTSTPATRGGSLDDIYDVLVGGDGGWDVPSRIPRMLVAAVFTVLGTWFLWTAFHSQGYYDRNLGGEAVVGLVCLYFAWRALEQWVARRRR